MQFINVATFDGLKPIQIGIVFQSEEGFIFFVTKLNGRWMLAELVNFAWIRIINYLSNYQIQVLESLRTENQIEYEDHIIHVLSEETISKIFNSSVYNICFKNQDTFYKIEKGIDDVDGILINPNQHFMEFKIEPLDPFNQINIDDILDRINTIGFENLTKHEKEFLDQKAEAQL